MIENRKCGCGGRIVPVVFVPPTDRYKSLAAVDLGSYATGECCGDGTPKFFLRYRCSGCRSDYDEQGNKIELYSRPSGLWRGKFIDGRFMPHAARK
jgi:hypothetical protein